MTLDLFAPLQAEWIQCRFTKLQQCPPGPHAAAIMDGRRRVVVNSCCY